MSSFLSRKPHARISSVTLNPYSPTASPNPQATSFTQSNSSFDSYAAHPARTTYSSSGTTLSLTTTVSHHGSYFLAGLLQFMSLFSDRTVDLLATDRKVRENCLRTAVLQGVVLVAVLVGKAFGLGSLYTATVVVPLLLGATYLGSTAGSDPPSAATLVTRASVCADWVVATFSLAYLSQKGGFWIWILLQPFVIGYTALTNTYFIFDPSWSSKHMVLSAQFKTLRQHWAYFLGLALPPTLFLSLFSLLNITLLPLLVFSASIPLLQTLPATSRPLPISPDYPSAWGMGSTAGTGMRVGDSISLMRSEGAFDGDDSGAGGAGLLPGHPFFPKSLPVLYFAQIVATAVNGALGLEGGKGRGAKKHAGGGFHQNHQAQGMASGMNGYSYGQNQMHGVNGYGGYGSQPQQGHGYGAPNGMNGMNGMGGMSGMSGMGYGHQQQQQGQVLFDYNQQAQQQQEEKSYPPPPMARKSSVPPPPQIRLQQPSISGGPPLPPGKKDD